MSRDSRASKAWLKSLLITAFAVMWCSGCSQGKEADQEEYAVIKVVLDDFMHGWGLSGPAVRPTECRLVDRFRPVDRYELQTLLSKITAEIKSAAIQLETKQAGAALPEMMDNCKLAHNTNAMSDPWTELRTKPDDRVCILRVSRVGLDREHGTGVLVLNESRAWLAGTTFLVVLHRANSHWVVADRIVLSRS